MTNVAQPMIKRESVKNYPKLLLFDHLSRIHKVEKLDLLIMMKMTLFQLGKVQAASFIFLVLKTNPVI